MTTLSKALLLAALPLCHAGAVSPGDAFATHREGVLSGTVTAADGVRFGTARVRPISDSSASDTAARNKSRPLASANLLLRVMAERVEWPEALSEETRHALSEALAERLNLSATVRGPQIVWQAREAGRWVAVAALPEAEVQAVPRVTFAEARKLLLGEASWLAPHAPVEALLALHATHAPLPAAIDRAPWIEALTAARFATPRLSALPRLAGRAPLGADRPPTDPDFTAGQTAYAQGDLPAAYASFLASAERAWTYDALNMAGNDARRLGHHHEAVPLLLHAAFLRPTSPHPWVHLAFVAKARGEQTLCERCCQEAEKRAPDSWSVKQIARLRESVPPPPVTPKPIPLPQ